MEVDGRTRGGELGRVDGVARYGGGGKAAAMRAAAAIGVPQLHRGGC